MASQLVESHRAGAEAVKGHDDCKKRSVDFLEELRLPKGLFLLDDMEEFGYNRESRFTSILQKKKKEHPFKKIKQTVSYTMEVTAFVDKGKIRKVTGIKTRELFLWLSLVEVYVDESCDDKVTFKTGTGLSDTFDAAAFDLRE